VFVGVAFASTVAVGKAAWAVRVKFGVGVEGMPVAIGKVGGGSAVGVSNVLTQPTAPNRINHPARNFKSTISSLTRDKKPPCEA
jgi:hypothetical protein